MSDNDFEDDEDALDFDAPDDGEDLADFEGGGQTLGDMWRNNPLVKIGVIAGGLITIIGAIILFGGSEQRPLTSQIRAGDEVKEAPGGAVSEAYKEAVQEGSIQRTEEAVRTGGSAIPTPVDTPVTRLSLPEEDLSNEDPLERWRRIQEERQRQAGRRKEPQELGNPHAAAIDALATAMVEQMEGILDSREPAEPMHIVITEQEWLDTKRDKEAKALEEAMAAQAAANGDEIVNILIPAGSIEYAQLLIEANSDIEDGPVLAHLVSGPLAGARLLGEFEREGEVLYITFSTIVIDGIAHPTNAVALDPDTTLPGMATEVDHRYFTRVILPAAAAFIEGMGEAISETSTTTVVSTGGATVTDSQEPDTEEQLYKGVETAAEKLGEIFDEQADDTEILVRVSAGTPMALLFYDPVTDETN